MDRVRRDIIMGDTLFFAQELQLIDDSLVPLIGYLTEIRMRKIHQQLVTYLTG
ncbi:MAG: hypothetical protein P8O07_06515 [Crocinitomicaceae bacterium]|nr:hypothetical protein [Crocinitomicaceae bacterium]